MALTAFPNGVSSFGVPILGSGELPVTTGKYWFVDSVTGANGNSGTNPSEAFATLDYAVGRCTAAKGDVIVLMPGHAETVTASNTTLDVSGITVIGLGSGLLRPTFTYGAAAATITVSAANITVKNCHFIGNFDNVAAAFTIGAAKDFRLESNTFVDNSSSLHFLSILVTGATANAADGLSIIGNRWSGLAVAPAAAFSILGTIDRLSVLGNYVQMASTDDEGSFITFADKNGTNVEIGWNQHYVVGSTGAAVGIFLTGSGTAFNGTVHNNYVRSLDTTAELLATAGTKLAYFNNLYTGTADASGKVWPAADAA
jgi:hypothetical protein